MEIENEGCLKEIQSSKSSSGQIIDHRSNSREGRTFQQKNFHLLKMKKFF